MELTPGSLIERVATTMQKADWAFTADEEKHMIIFLSTSDVCCLRSMLLCKEREEQVVFIIGLERRCPERYRNTMMDYCNRVNFMLQCGFFACDPRDGEIRFRHSADVESIQLTTTFIDNFLKVGLGTVRRHYEQLQGIMSGLSIEAVQELSS